MIADAASSRFSFSQRTLERVNHHRPSTDVNLDDATAANHDRGSGNQSSILFNNLLVIIFCPSDLTTYIYHLNSKYLAFLIIVLYRPGNSCLHRHTHTHNIYIYVCMYVCRYIHIWKGKTCRNGRDCLL